MKRSKEIHAELRAQEIADEKQRAEREELDKRIYLYHNKNNKKTWLSQQQTPEAHRAN